MWVPSLLGPVASGVAAGVRGLADTAGQFAGFPRRNVWWRPGRCHIEVHGVHGAAGERVARRVERALERHPGVVWARVNAPSERVVVAVASQPPDERELVALVEHAEGHQLDDMDEFDEWRPEPHHPAEGPRTRESVAALTADTVGLGISIARQLAPWVRLPPEAPAFVDALKYHPKLRHLVAAVSGTEQAETAVGSVARAF